MQIEIHSPSHFISWLISAKASPQHFFLHVVYPIYSKWASLHISATLTPQHPWQMKMKWWIWARCSRLFTYVVTLMAARGRIIQEKCNIIWGKTKLFSSRLARGPLIGMNKSIRKTGPIVLPALTSSSLFSLYAEHLLMYFNSGSRFSPVARAGKPAFSVRAP